MKTFEKEFDFILEKAKAVKAPTRAVIAGADAENILHAAFQAEADGMISPVLVGDENKILALLEKFGYKNDRKYEICHVEEGESVVQHAIDIVNIGRGDILMRGNTSTRDFLMPILNKANKLVKEDHLVSEVAMVKVPDYEKVLTISDASVLVRPSINQRKKVIQNMVEILNQLGIEHPSVAVLSMVEKPSFHLRASVEAQTIAREHAEEPIADCEVVGPIPWDLIVSKEAARLKNYNCPYCGEFDAVCVPDVVAGNTIVKILNMSASANSLGVLAGTNIPIAIASRGSSMEQAYLSLATCVALRNAK